MRISAGGPSVTLRRYHTQPIIFLLVFTARIVNVSCFIWNISNYNIDTRFIILILVEIWTILYVPGTHHVAVVHSLGFYFYKESTPYRDDR